MGPAAASRMELSADLTEAILGKLTSLPGWRPFPHELRDSADLFDACFDDFLGV
jgi:hypothetical protein